MVDWQKERVARRVADQLWNFVDRLFKILFWIAAAAVLAMLHAKTGIAVLGWIADALGLLIIAAVTLQILAHVLEWSETRIEIRNLGPLIQTAVVVAVIAVAATGTRMVETTMTDIATTTIDAITVATN
jgi:hypothetical protein